MQKLTFIVFITALLLSQYFFAQVQVEVHPPDHIRTVIFKAVNNGDQFPVVKLGEPMYLSFDDLNADEADYYYKIVHCNYDWTPSNLLKSQYIDGLDNQRIMDYKNSVTTLQPYSHYRLRLPNQQTKLRLSGNYILKVFNNYDELVFSRRFIVYKEQVSVGVTVKRSRVLTDISTKQVIHFVVHTGNTQIVNPQQEVKVALLQNHYWEGAITGIRPQFFSGNQLMYRYNEETSFNGNNEFLFFDNKEIRVANNGIAKVQLRELYHHYLFSQRSRAGQPYTYNPDINGDFTVRTLDGANNDTHADYAWVHFSLHYTPAIGMKDVYVFGKFNNYQLTEENKLTRNETSGNLETAIRLKQGFYNYKYVLADANGTVNTHAISGNYSETENNYLVIVYYRNFGELYDSIIGIGSANATTISN
ncbi:MAG: type IX secretion system plug protein domain-containing protein [Bacteroidota bacterium]